MKVHHSPRLTIFDFPELANKELTEKLNKLGEDSVNFHVEFGSGFKFMVNSYAPGGNQHCLLDVREGTEVYNLIRAYETLFSVLGRNVKAEPARIYDLTLYEHTNIQSCEEILQKIIADKRVKLKKAKDDFSFPKGTELLQGKIKDSKETFTIKPDHVRSNQANQRGYTFYATIYGESSRSFISPPVSRLNDLKLLDNVLSNACYK